MAYLVLHHGTYWFQIRVPKPLTTRYGRVLIRQNLRRPISRWHKRSPSSFPCNKSVVFDSSATLLLPT